MNRKSQIAGCLIFAALFFAARPMRSEGPLLVGGPSDAMGVPYAWSSTSLAFNNSTKTLNYWTDQGTLGSVSSPDSFVAAAFAAWSGVATANFNFSRQGQLGANVIGTNALAVLDSVETCGSAPGTTQPSGSIAKPVTIIYDSDGSIIRALGGDPSSTLGMATALCPTSNGTNNTYNRGEAIINGSAGVTQTELKTVMIHEFGHMLGLDHTQINLDCLTTAFPNPCVADGSIAGVPIMFPVLLDDKTAPITDDIAGFSALYPVTGASPPAGKTLFNTLGEIRGKVFFADGVTQAQGFNVIARSVANPRTVAVSNLSGYLFTEIVGNAAIPSSANFADPFFSRDQTVIGFFDIPGLPPGDYTVEVEAVNNSGIFPFVYGSSIGPIGGILGFQFALPGSCIPRQFYDTTIGTDPCTSANATTVNVPPASTLVKTGVDISLIGTGQRYDAWEDGP